MVGASSRAVAVVVPFCPFWCSDAPAAASVAWLPGVSEPSSSVASTGATGACRLPSLGGLGRGCEPLVPVVPSSSEGPLSLAVPLPSSCGGGGGSDDGPSVGVVVVGEGCRRFLTEPLGSAVMADTESSWGVGGCPSQVVMAEILGLWRGRSLESSLELVFLLLHCRQQAQFVQLRPATLHSHGGLRAVGVVLQQVECLEQEQQGR